MATGALFEVTIFMISGLRADLCLHTQDLTEP